MDTTKQVNDGGRASPRSYTQDHAGNPAWEQDGRTLRDWFAGQALAGWIAAIPTSRLDEYDADDWQFKAHQQDLARAAYGYADAMLAARGAS